MSMLHYSKSVQCNLNTSFMLSIRYLTTEVLGQYKIPLPIRFKDYIHSCDLTAKGEGTRELSCLVDLSTRKRWRGGGQNHGLTAFYPRERLGTKLKESVRVEAKPNEIENSYFWL